jgi:hypothetical protein
MSEIYADIFCFAPHFLGQAMYKGDPAERFKLTVNFAFSILHAMQTNGSFGKRPFVPMLGETYEGHYIFHEVYDIFMETTYVDYSYQDLLTGTIRKVKAETPTTLIHIMHPDKNF